MGNQLAGIAPLQIFPVEYYLADLPDFLYDANLGSTRFFKVARATSREGLSVVKVFAINDPSLPLKYHRDCIEDLKTRLSSATNCLPFQKCMLTDKAGILIRQFVKDNLYDRISTRPFLNNIEKKWIAFQLLQALKQCENARVCHGDIKLENIMVTSWNWVFLTDFASFKPTYLPEDNPADFSYFFDTSRRRICYIAPERFVKTLNSDNLSNASISTLVLPDEEVKKGDLTLAMDVFSLGCALAELFTEGHAPFDFSQLLAYRGGEYSPWKVLEKIDDLNIRDLVRSMMEKDASKRSKPSEYLEEQRNRAFPEYFYSVLDKYLRVFAKFPILSPDEKVHRLKKDIKNLIDAIIKCEKLDDAYLSDSYEDYRSEGLVILASFLTSNLRALKHCTSKLNALNILKELYQYLSPDILLDRLLPNMICLIKDGDPKVRVAVIETLTECLMNMEDVPQSGSNIFPEYILPNLLHVANDDAVIVRMAFAENIAYLAETALRFLEMTQINAEQDNTRSSVSEIRYSHYHVSYDQELKTLQELVQQCVTVLLSDPSNSVKQILLQKGITQLCVFFGRQKGNDVLLSHMITYLNDKDDCHLRGAFFDAVVGVATYIGWQCYPVLKPLLQQGLSDSEEFVISKALRALVHFTELGLIQKQVLYELVAEASPLLLHPNLWIRQGAVGFVRAVAKCLSLADIQCHLIPHLEPFLKHSIIQVDSELVVLNALQDALPRSVFDYLVKSPSLIFFLESLNERKLMRSVIKSGHPAPFRDLDTNVKAVYRRLLSDGMTYSMEDQILAMKDYLLKLHIKKSSDAHISEDQDDGIVELATLDHTPKIHSLLLTYDNQSYQKALKVSPSKKSLKKKPNSQEGPTIIMNEEWQHMFGTADLKSPTTPKSQGSSDLPPAFGQREGSGKEQNVTDSPERSTPEVVSNDLVTPALISMQEQFYMASLCTPCEKELHSLIEKKQEEWVRDEILNEYSTLGSKEEKAGKQVKPPCGFLIAHLHEHKRAVNRVEVIPNSTLFATCSNDGTVKVWDCEKMEGKNIANRSRLTYSRLEGPVSSLTSCQNMQSLAAASDNGSIHVFRIAHDSMKPTALHTRVLDPQEEGCVVDLTHFDAGSQSILTYATLYGSIVGWDLRSPGTAWKLENHPRHGLITSFRVHYNHCWLVLGTASGKIICWDLRFQLPIATIIHPTGSRIHSLLLHPKHQSAVLASVQGNNEVSMWDIETQAKIMTLWASNIPPLSQTQASEHSVHSMCWASGGIESALLTGGSDIRLRYWNFENPAESLIISSAANDPVYPGVANYKSRLIDGTEVIQEVFTRSRARANYDPPRRYPETPHPGHSDCISGLAMVQASQLLTVSASRDGIIKVWK